MTRRDKVKNEIARKKLEAGGSRGEIREARPQWKGHVLEKKKG